MMRRVLAMLVIAGLVVDGRTGAAQAPVGVETRIDAEAEPAPAPVAEAEPAPAPVAEPTPEPEPDAAPVAEAEGEPEATAEDDGRLTWTLGIDVMAQYLASIDISPSETGFYHQFRLDRAMIWAGVAYDTDVVGTIGARLLIEETPSGDEGALLGIGGDSFVVRIREAWAGWDPLPWLHLRGGVVRSLLQPALENVEQLRPIARGAQWRYELITPADLGATVSADLPRGFGRVGFGVYNGESYRSRERNRGKNIEMFAEVRPLAFLDAARPLTLMLAGTIGSEGAGSARTDRYSGVLAWNAEGYALGATFTYALGYAGNGAQESWIASGFARAWVLEHLFLGARVYAFQRNVDVADDQILTVEASVGGRVFRRLEGYLTLRKDLPGDGALDRPDPWVLGVVLRFHTEEQL